MSTSESFQLPVIDLKKARNPAQRQAVARQLVQALETVGFLFLDNVEGYDAAKLQRNVRWFFSLSDEEKMSLSRKIWNPQSENYYRGYFPLQPGEVSYKEGFEVGLEKLSLTEDDIHPFFKEPNQWPSGMEGAQKFREEMIEYYGAMLNGGAEVLRLVSLGSGLDEDWFESMFFPGSLSTLRLLHYPPRPDVPPEARDGNTILCGPEHTDSGFVTLLSTFDYTGLQIRREDGSWADVPRRPNSLVMNIGDILSAMSGWKFKATRHRVIDTGLDRFSVPFFFEPHYTADIARVLPWQQTEVRGPTSPPGSLQTYGPFLIKKMSRFAEYRQIIQGL